MTFTDTKRTYTIRTAGRAQIAITHLVDHKWHAECGGCGWTRDGMAAYLPNYVTEHAKQCEFEPAR